jgi:hypothetical protein
MLRKEELDLKLGLPGRFAVWPVNIVERLDPNVYGLSADREETLHRETGAGEVGRAFDRLYLHCKYVLINSAHGPRL